jgi:hypothetical protein
LIVRYGLNKQDGIEYENRRCLQFNSALGYVKTHYLTGYHTAKFNFNTQFTDGYAYPNKKFHIRPFAPAYIFLGLGAEYAKDKNKLLYLSLSLPITAGPATAN